MTFDVPCPSCLTEAVTVAVDAEMDVDGATGQGRAIYDPGTPSDCAACGHELTPAERVEAKDSAVRFARDESDSHRSAR